MHVAMLCSYFNFKVGGVEKHVYYLIQGLLKHGVRVTLITGYKDPYTNTVIPQYEGRRLTIIPLEYAIAPLNNPLMLGLFSTLAKIDPDIVHIHDHYFYGSMIASLLKKIIRRPLILTIHTSKLSYGNILKDLLVHMYDTALGSIIFRAADKIIAVTRTTADELISRGVHRDKIAYIPNFLTVDTLESHDEKTYDYIKGLGEFRILYVGRLVFRKGLHILIEAFKTAIKEELIPHNSLLMIVGKGPLEFVLEKEIRSNSTLNGKVKLWGVVPDSILGALYRASDVVVLPSLSGETTSLVLQEAIFFEKPFVASLVGGIRDYFVEGFWGFYVPPGDPQAIARSLGKIYKLVIENRGLIRERVQENKERLIKIHSSENIIKRTLQIYNEVLSN